MRKYVTKSMALLMTLVLALSVFVGCGKKEAEVAKSNEEQAQTQAKKDDNAGSSEEKWEGTIKVQMIGDWAMEDTMDPISGKERKGIQVLKDEFEKQYPGATLEFVLMGWDSYTQKTQAMLTVGECDVYQVPGIAGLTDQGLLEPLASYIEKDNFSLDNYIKGQVDGWKAMGPEDTELQIYGLPFVGDTRVIVYDTKLFDEWGVEYLSDTPTLEEIEEKAVKMTGKNPVTGEQNYGLMWKGKDTADTVVNIAEGLGGTWGTGFRLKDLQFNFNSPEFVDAAKWMVNMKQYAPSGMLTDQGMEKWGTPDNNIAINLRFDPIHLLRVVDIPGLGERYKAARLFVNEKEGMGGIFVGSPFSIGKDSKNKELAWEFLKFSSSDFFQRFVYENYQEIPVIKSAHEWDSVKTIPQMEFMLDTMDVLWIPRYPYRAAQPRYILSENVEKLILGDVTPEDALNTAQKQAEDWVKELNK